jgi:hypothetical protein
MKTRLRLQALVLAVLAVVALGGCAVSSVTYSYEPLFSFAALKTYRWAEDRPQYWRDSLLESNVRFQADRVLQSKGLAVATDKADFIVSMRYEGSQPSELRALTLSISGADHKEVLWRGTATGSIRTDAASDGLKTAVEGILANFPPSAKK